MYFALLKDGNHDALPNIICSTSFWLVYLLLELIYDLRVQHYIRAIVILTIVSDSVFRIWLFDLYVTSFTFDRIQHVVGTYAFSLFFYAILLRFTGPPRMVFLLVLSIGISIGAIYELVEFLSDMTLKPIVPNQPSLLDTDLDLLCDVFGASLAAIHTGVFGYLKKP